MVVFSAIGVEVVRRIAARRYPGAEATTSAPGRSSGGRASATVSSR